MSPLLVVNVEPTDIDRDSMSELYISAQRVSQL